ncbi:MAG: glycosyltransferase family 4 protein [Actinomycetota bacterium]|nr:glycosyltransferase family 4 protein [Actinomycetota bacterium]
MTPLRVAVVMPPVVDIDHTTALDQWPTFTRALEALRATGEIDPVGCCRTAGHAATVTRNAVEYYFEPDDRQLARRLTALHPAVVHLHGMGFTRLLVSIRGAVGRTVPILLQHHGEPPPDARRTRMAQRITRRLVAGYLFTGAEGQAEPFRRAGTISRSAPVYEVLESASHLDGLGQVAPPALCGKPCVLWVGRLIPSKDPLCAVRAIAKARSLGSGAELHMLATDRSMEPSVWRMVDEMGAHDIVHLHQPVAHAEMTGWFSRADTYLSTSHREGSNYSLIEALGYGCSPVVTEIPSHAAIVGGLASRFAVGDADGAGSLIAAPRLTTPEQVTAYSRRCLSWSTIADQLAGTYRRSLRS